ncbi:hypothetical protein DUNSADRAFT_14145 [Dunaliella salina]|uniref:Encoded protein n=1 Tax=Dunaliella salina TaxID=3046 RepID=A0ABQ7H2R0_DUNSA|nr:hypothetical protein DUNSADRAFT_14145 [Dunaliella salina]|eukprot:KAF5841142.1 hypothetical protein DUNSADRAFT_14145 [Dunaliella salina]
MATQQTSAPDPQQVAVGSKVAKPGLQGGASGRRAPLGDLSNISAPVQQRAQGKDGKQEATKDKSEQGHKEVMPARERSGSKKRPSLAGQSTSVTKQPRIYSGRPQGQGQSKEHEVTASEEEMYEAPRMQFLRFCSRLEKLVLVAIIMELQASGRDFVQIQVRPQTQQW